MTLRGIKESASPEAIVQSASPTRLGLEMANLTAEKFVELVRRSRLVEEDHLMQAVTDCRQLHSGVFPDEPQVIAQQLIDAELLTRWQRDRILEGKYKGFFLGKYKVLGLIGTGGMSSIYLAEHTLIHQRRALKVLPRRRVNDTSYLERFRREAQATAKLDHPNIVRAYDIDNEGDTHYLVMEYIEGEDLQSVVRTQGPLDYPRVADYIIQAAQGLQHAHESGLIHRDVKPSNLLLDERGCVKLLDLGLARFSADDDKASLTLAYNENVLGTADYLAPEQALNSHTADLRADIYGLGCSMYFLLTGHPPFVDGTLAQRIARHQVELPPDIRGDRPDCPVGLLEICVRMMSKRAEDRQQSAREVCEALAAWLNSEGLQQGMGRGNSQLRRDPLVAPTNGGGARAGDTASERARETVKGLPSKTGAGALLSGQPQSEVPSDELDLGVEVFSSLGGSSSLKSVVEQRRERQRPDRTLPIIAAVSALVILALLITAFVFSGWLAPPPSPAPQPTLRPQWRPAETTPAPSTHPKRE